MISKERAAGSYHLSAYVMAKMLSEDPLELLLPVGFSIFVFPIAGLLQPGAFFGIVFIILIHCLFCQVSTYFLFKLVLNV